MEEFDTPVIVPNDTKPPLSPQMEKFYDLSLDKRLKLLEYAIYLDSVGHHAGSVTAILTKMIEFIGIDEPAKPSS